MKKDFICLVIITVLTVLGTFKLFNNQKDYLGEVEQKYKDGMALNLDGSVTTEALSNLLEKYNYIEEKTECDFVAGLLVDSIIKKSGRLPNMGELNQPRHYIPESLITEHKEECPDLAKRLEATYRALGVDDEVKEIYEKKTSFNQGNGNVTLNVKVENKKLQLQPNISGIKVIQSVLGHADLSTTINTYIHATEDFKKEEFSKQSRYLSIGAADLESETILS